MGETAIGVFTGVITSAGTFYAMCVTEFPGLRDFGFLVGTGILLCGVTILFLLPAMIAYVEGEKVTKFASLSAFLVFPVMPLPLLRWMERRRLRKAGKASKLYLHSFGVERLLTVAVRWPAPTAVVSLAICLILGLLATRIELSENLKDLRSPNNRGVLVQEEIGRRFGGSLNYMIVMCHGATFDEALERNRKVTARLDALAASGDIQGYESLLTYLPARDAQEAVIRELAPGSPGAFDVDRIEKTFRKALDENGFKSGSYDEYLKRLRTMLRPTKALTIDDLEQRGLGELVGRYHRVVNGEHVTATYLFPNPERLDRDRLEPVARSIEGGDPKIEATSVVLVGLELRRLFRRDALLAVSLGLALVAILLYIDFRKLSLTVIAMLQLVLGVVMMLGGMKVLGIQMNFINAFATTMILGVGVDYGIHMIHRLMRATRPGDEGTLETGKAVVMAALTNVAGFGTVAFSNYPGLKGVGIVCILGTIGCLFTSLTLLPALMTLYVKPGGHADDAGPSGA
jgi:predicted RND superfamily exporter protein